MIRIFKRYMSALDASTAIEYGLIMSALGVVILATVLSIGDWGEGVFSTLSGYFS